MVDSTPPPYAVIYALFCWCSPGSIRYVGKTRSSVKRRVDGHIDESMHEPPTTPKRKWVRKHVELSHQLGWITLDAKPTCEEELNISEREWIARLRDQRSNLMNVRDGGDGGWQLTPESKQRQQENLKQAMKQPETRERKSAASIKYWADEAARSARAEQMRQQWQDPKQAERFINVSRERMKDPEVRRKFIQAGQSYFAGADGEKRRSDRGKRAMHVRWHVKRGLINPDCEFCRGVQST